MPQYDSERIEVGHEVRRSLAIENELTPIQARSFVRSLQTSWRVPTIQWRDDETYSQFEDAHRLIHAAEIFRNIEGVGSKNSTDCYRRAGELFEWLSRASTPPLSIVPIELLTAAAYQLGGLPAMASGLLSQVDVLNDELQLYSNFLQADFDQVIKSISDFWKAHTDLTDFDATDQILAEESDDRLSWYFVVETVRSLGLISDSLRRGNDARLERGLLKLSALNKYASRAMAEDVSLFLTLLNAVAEGFRDASIYLPMQRLAELSPAHNDRLRAFARGQFRRGRGILWASQRHGLDRLLHQSSFALCTPTGSGKTLIANVALVKELLLRENEPLSPLGLYLVPSRALAGEVEAKLTSELGRDFIVTGLYGGADWGITDYWLNADKPTVLIATVEKADALMRYLGPLLLARLRLLIVDEAHQVVSDGSDSDKVDFAEHTSRSLRLENFVSRLLNLRPDIVRIALTAVAGGAALPVARWIEGRQEAEAVGLNYRSTRQVVGMLEATPQGAGRLLLELLNGSPLYVRGRGAPVYLNLQIPPMPQLPAAMRNSLNHYNEVNVLWTALHLLEGDRRILISVTQSPEQTMRWYAEAFELPDWQELPVFELLEDERLQARFEEAHAACIDYCGENSYEVLLLDRGIATNHGQMPQRLRRLMIDLIERRVCPIAIATATLTEGVNLPFDLIFLTSLKRTYYDQAEPQPEKRRKVAPLSTSEFRNLAGRAGRPGATKGMEGMTLIAVPQRPSTTAQGTRGTQLNQIRNLKGEYDDLIQRLSAEDREQGAVTSPLSLLLHAIYDRASTLLGIQDENGFLEWLEGVLPEEVSADAGTAGTSHNARLADSIDELDGVLLSALEELSRAENRELEGADAEEFLANLWQRTFAHVAAVQEDWLERAFVKRGRAVIESIYPDADERKRLYQYGFSPFVGRRFEVIAPNLRAVLDECSDYGTANSPERLRIFQKLGAPLEHETGFGFRVRDTVTDTDLLENWQDVLAWWMKADEAPSPEPQKLRAWQRFVADNLEFRLGVAVGAVVAQAWSDGTDDPLEIPNLATWRETTGLPWFGFWTKELLRWGTLDPFVAFALSQGLSRTREEASGCRAEFETWLQDNVEEVTAEDLIDPQQYLEWQRSIPQVIVERTTEKFGEIELTGTSGQLGKYHVIPVLEEEGVNWIDAAGYSLARSGEQHESIHEKSFRNDYDLVEDAGFTIVRLYS